MNKEIFESKSKHYEKALNSLKIAIIRAKSDESFKKDEIEYWMNRDSIIQRFEYSFELSWKYMRFILEKYDWEIETRTVKQVLKSSFKAWYIDNLAFWFKMSDYRNKTSHEYEEDIAEDLYIEIPKFFEEMQRFYEFIKIKYGQWYFD